MNELVAASEPMMEKNSEPMMEKEYTPSRKELLTNYEINIRFLSGKGCTISVGCKQIAFEDNQKAMDALNAYVSNPFEESKKWNQIFNQ